jgi:uncharacterized Zn finger protein
VPCKHLAATFYLLAEAFGHDPFLILRWRGRELEPLLARLRELRSGSPAPPAPSAQDDAAVPSAAGTALALIDLTPPPAEPEHFWLEPPPLPARPVVLDVDAALLLRQLPAPAAAIGGERLTERLRLAYERFPHAAE